YRAGRSVGGTGGCAGRQSSPSLPSRIIGSMTPVARPFTLLSGNSVPELVSAIASRLRVRPGGCRVDRYPDGETGARIESEVAGRAVVIVQSTSPPVNDHLMELLVLADAARRAGAETILAAVPYFGYARS